MALRLRRGTDAQRALITPAEGELVYITDTNEIYVGDGTTVGGVRITGEVVNELGQLNDVDAALPQDGDVLQYDSPTGDWVAGELPLVDLSDVNALGILDGQVLVWDATAQAFVPANYPLAATFEGDVSGSVFADDSTLMVDGNNNRIVGIVDNTLTQTEYLLVRSDGVIQPTLATFNTLTTGSNGSNIDFFAARDSLTAPNSLQPGDTIIDLVGAGWTGTDHTTTAVIKLAVDKYTTVSDGVSPGRIIFLTYDDAGATGISNVMVFNRQGRLGINTDDPQEKLDVRGNAVVSGQVDAASFRGSLVADDSTPIVDAIGGTITAQGFVQFGSYTTAERDAISAANGMVVYNSSDNRFQGYQNGAWINIDDGTAA